jgi:CheY-like chemotaxis protein
MGESGKIRSVLVVDDHADAASIVADILCLHGHRARFAVGGIEALVLAGEFLPDVIFLDLCMLYLDGYTIARRLRRSYLNRDLRLIALTACGDELSRARAKAAGFDAHLVKPAALGEIVRSIQGT